MIELGRDGLVDVCIGRRIGASGRDLGLGESGIFSGSIVVC